MRAHMHMHALCARAQVLDVSGALRRPTRFCAAVVQLRELRELYMAGTALFTLPDATLASFWTGLAALGGERIDHTGDYHGPRGLQLLDVGGFDGCKSPDIYEHRQRQMLQACNPDASPSPSPGPDPDPKGLPARGRVRLRCPAPVPLSHACRPRCVRAQTLAPLCRLEILAPRPTGRLAPRPAGATAADFKDGGAPDRSSGPRAKAWQAFADRVALCRFIALAASNLPDRKRVRWVRQEIFGEQLPTDERADGQMLQAAVARLRNCYRKRAVYELEQYEFLTFAGTWFRGLSRLPPSLPTSSDDDDESDDELDSEPADSEPDFPLLLYPELV